MRLAKRDRKLPVTCQTLEFILNSVYSNIVSFSLPRKCLNLNSSNIMLINNISSKYKFNISEGFPPLQDYLLTARVL